MTEGSYKLYARLPGGQTATIDGPHGRHVWIRGVLRPRKGVAAQNPRSALACALAVGLDGRFCPVCSRVFAVGEDAWRATMTNDYELRKARICASCVDSMGAVEGRTGSDG